MCVGFHSNKRFSWKPFYNKHFGIDKMGYLFDFVLTYAILTRVMCRFWEVFRLRFAHAKV